MLDKKKLKKSICILFLIAVIIIAIIFIRNTLSRYETVATSEKDVDVAFWMFHDDFQSASMIIQDIFPSNNSFDYTFSVSNFEADEDGNINRRAETDLEYELTVTTTTNLPLEYVIEKNGEILATQQNIITDEDGTYYREILIEPSQMQQGEDLTDEYTIKVTFPKENDTNAEFSDLIELFNVPSFVGCKSSMFALIISLSIDLCESFLNNEICFSRLAD